MKKETNDITRTQAELTARLVHGFDFIMDVNEGKVEKKYTEQNYAEKKYTATQHVEEVQGKLTPEKSQADLTARLVHGFDFIMDVSEGKVEKKYAVSQDAEEISEKVTPVVTEKPKERHSTIVDKQDGHDFLLGKLGLSKPAEKVREAVNVHEPEVNEPEVEATYRPGEFFPVKVWHLVNHILSYVIDGIKNWLVNTAYALTLSSTNKEL